MDNLPLIIGKAPSELTREELKLKLEWERDRIRRGLEYFRIVKTRGRKKPTKAMKISAQLQAAGLTPQEFMKGVEKLKQLKEQKKLT